MRCAQPGLKPALMLPHVGGTRVVGAVRKPRCNVPATRSFGNRDGVENMIQRLLPNIGSGVSQRPVFVLLILKHIGAHRADANAQLLCSLRRRSSALHTIGEVPQNVDSD